MTLLVWIRLIDTRAGWCISLGISAIVLRRIISWWLLLILSRT
jgi:hypothetical protein